MSRYNLTFSRIEPVEPRCPPDRKLLTPTPTRRNRCWAPRATRSLSESAIAVSSWQDEGGDEGVWLRVRILNSAVFNFSTTVLAIRLSLRDAAQVSSASLRIIGSVSLSG